jgi:hypothetical protein
MAYYYPTRIRLARMGAMVYDFVVDFERVTVVETSPVILSEHQKVYFETRNDAEEWIGLVKVVEPHYRNFRVRPVLEKED